MGDRDLEWWRPDGEDPGVSGDSAAGVELLRVWMNHVGIVAALRLGSSSTPAVDGPAKEVVATLLRLVSDAARQISRSAPLLGILVPPDDARAAWRTTCDRWSRDQEWHRGDFLLVVESSEEGAEARMRSVLEPESDEAAWSPILRSRGGEQAYVAHVIAQNVGEDTLARAILDSVAAGPEAVLEAVAHLRAEALATIQRAGEEARRSATVDGEGHGDE